MSYLPCAFCQQRVSFTHDISLWKGANPTNIADIGVTLAPTLADARRPLEAGSLDLLLVDYDLDDGKGDALLNEAHAPAKAVPVIGVSSHDEGNTALLRAGAVAV